MLIAKVDIEVLLKCFCKFMTVFDQVKCFIEFSGLAHIKQIDYTHIKYATLNISKS